MMQKVKRCKKIMTYLVLGGTTAGIEFISFAILLKITHIYIASLASFLVGLAASFLFNKFFVFKNSKKTNKSEVAKFICLGVINSQLSSIITLAYSWVMPSYLAKGLTMAMIAVWNYIIMNKLIFKKDQVKAD